MSEFAINGVQPPAYARPDVTMPPLVKRTESSISATGKSIKPGSNLISTIGRQLINAAGLRWYGARSGFDCAQVTVRLLDPEDGVWRNYTAIMSPPQFETSLTGGSYYQKFMVVFSNLEAA